MAHCVTAIFLSGMVVPQIVICGGQSLFASLGQLELLWQNELEVVKIMESVVSEHVTGLKPFKRYSIKSKMQILLYSTNKSIVFDNEGPDFLYYRYIRQHYLHRLNQTPNIEYLGHPINAYHLLRHIVYGWEYLSQHLSALVRKRPISNEIGK